MANLSVKTSFNTILQLDTETLAKRILAYVLDVLVLLAYWFLMIWLMSLIDIDFEGIFGSDSNRVSWGWWSIITLPMIFYTLISEVLSGGYTIGKFIAKVKVVKVDGFQPAFADFFIRWIFRMIDLYVFIVISVSFGGLAGFLSVYTLGLVGVIAIVRNKKGQRLGDMVAGTTVIRSKIQQSINITILKEVSSDYKPIYSQVVKLSDNDARIIKDTYEGAKKINDFKLIRKLVAKLEDVMGIKNTTDPNTFIENVLKDFNYYTQNM